MIVFDIECEKGHRFEGWFDDLQDLESQIAGGRVCCPVCESTDVRQIPSTFGVNRGLQRRQPGRHRPNPDPGLEALCQRKLRRRGQPISPTRL